jgi:hypothetical protein
VCWNITRVSLVTANVYFVQSTQRNRLRDLAVALMLTRVWQEFQYRINVCRVTRHAHIEHLY